VSELEIPFYGGEVETENVGFQTWKGSLLMAEFIFFNLKDFKNCNTLELGAGNRD